MVRLGWIWLALAVLAGCAPTEAGGPPLSRYHGASPESFFAAWGAPISSHVFDNGYTMYLWYSGRDSAYVPGHTDADLIGNTAWWEGHQKPRYEPRVECGVRILAGPDGTIHEILLHQSSKGWWRDERCRGIFGPPIVNHHATALRR